MSTPKMPKDAGGMSGEDLESIRRASGVMPQGGLVCKMLRHIDHLTAELARVEGELAMLRPAKCPRHPRGMWCDECRPPGVMS